MGGRKKLRGWDGFRFNKGVPVSFCRVLTPRAWFIIGSMFVCFCQDTTLNHWLLLCCSTASSLTPPENSSGGPWQQFPDFQSISRLSMACHSKLRCIQWLRPLLLSNSSIWSIRFRPNSSCQPLLTAPWLTWNSFEANSRWNLSEFVVCECVKAARGCCCFMIDGEDDKKIVSSFSRLCRLLTWHFAEVPFLWGFRWPLLLTWNLTLDALRQQRRRWLCRRFQATRHCIRNWTPLLRG